MSNRTDFPALAAELCQMYNLDTKSGVSGPPGPHAGFLWRLERELHNAFVAGQESRAAVNLERCAGAGTRTTCTAIVDLDEEYRCRACQRVILERTVEHYPGAASLFGRPIHEVAEDLGVELPDRETR